MNPLAFLDAIVGWMGLTLLHATALVLVAALLSITLLKRRAPALLAAMWTIVAVKFLLPPILPGDFGLSGLLSSVSAAWEPSAPAEAIAAKVDQVAGATGAPTAIPAAIWPLLLRTAALTYLALLVTLTIRSTLSVIRMRRHIRRLPGADRELAERVRAWTSRLGLRHRMSVVTTGDATTPYLFGLWRPTLVLPSRLLARLDDEALDALLLHELAHVRRGDLWIRWIQNAARVVFFFWPPVWWVCRRIERFTEMACDQWVVASGRVSRETYAKSLLEVVKAMGAAGAPPTAHALAFGRRGFELEERFKMILRTRTLAAKPTWLGILFLLGFAAFGWAGGVSQDPQKEAPTRKAVRRVHTEPRHKATFHALTQEQIDALMARADADGDGQLSAREKEAFEIELVETQKQAVLSQHPDADLDGDGALDDTELKTFIERGAQRRARVSRIPKEVDVNNDGVYSEAEMREFELRQRQLSMERALKEDPDADLDGNGYLDEEEWQELRAGRARERRSQILEQHPDLDKDGDGELSEAEFEGHLVHIELQEANKLIQRHPEMDANGDGEVSKEEVQEHLRLQEVQMKRLMAVEKELAERGVPAGEPVGVVGGVPAGEPVGAVGIKAAPIKGVKGTLRRIPEQGVTAVRIGEVKATPSAGTLVRKDAGTIRQGSAGVKAGDRKALLKQHPDADLNGDGKIDDDEAKALAVKLQKEAKKEPPRP